MYLHEITCSCYGTSFFFFKQKTAYEMRISDWSSDVCSSDLYASPALRSGGRRVSAARCESRPGPGRDSRLLSPWPAWIANKHLERKIGRASCRERVCQYV